jgi:hypothetical protein
VISASPERRVPCRIPTPFSTSPGSGTPAVPAIVRLPARAGFTPVIGFVGTPVGRFAVVAIVAVVALHAEDHRRAAALLADGDERIVGRTPGSRHEVQSLRTEVAGDRDRTDRRQSVTIRTSVFGGRST